jgi:hypothetical protein
MSWFSDYLDKHGMSAVNKLSLIHISEPTRQVR